MSAKLLLAAGVIISGLATTYASPFAILPRVASSAAPSASAATTVDLAPVLESIALGWAGTPTPSPTPAPTTSPTTPAPSPAWSINVKVGSTQFNIGDADPTTFEGIWSQACDGNGCDGGSPASFDYNGIDTGIKEAMSGTFTMTGNVNNNADWTSELLNVISAAAIPTVQCSQLPAQQCMRKRETPGVALNCGNVELNQCTMVNYIQATMYDDQSDMKAQITMNGASQADSEFSCDTFFGLINGAATAVEVAPVVGGALALIQVACDIATGN